jgi:twitching motility protein PilT
MDVNALLRRAVELGASDLHLKAGKPPAVRIDGEMTLLDAPPLGEDDLRAALATIAPGRVSEFEEAGELDLAYSVDDLPRFRVNVYRQRGSMAFSCRAIPRDVPTLEQLALPAGVRRLAEEHRGLVLVTGATGSGKSTTLAAFVNHLNESRRSHIVTIEDPIEFMHDDKQSIISQREVGIDTESFGQALRRALRQDPDTILIGELRDAETAQTALQAAESGHLVVSTMHTVDVAETVARLVEFFPEAKQQQVRSILAGVLRGVVSQRLLPRANGGRVPALELMIVNARIADLIRENRADEITEAIAEGEYFDMQTFEQALIALILDGAVDAEVAANAASNRHDFMVSLERAQKLQNPIEAPTVDQHKPEAEPTLRLAAQ